MKKLLALLATAGLSIGSAHAAVATYSNSYGPSLTDWTPGLSLALQQFNPALGSLNSVSFEFVGDLQAAFDVANEQNRSQQVTSHLTGKMTFTLPTADTFKISFSQQGAAMLPAFAVYSTTLADSKSVDATLLSNLSPFIGTGDFDIGLSALANWRITGGGNVAGGADTFARAVATVTYDYTEARRPLQTDVLRTVPEPGSLALSALALAGAGLGLRRRG